MRRPAPCHGRGLADPLNAGCLPGLPADTLRRMHAHHHPRRRPLIRAEWLFTAGIVCLATLPDPWNALAGLALLLAGLRRMDA